MKSRLRFPPFLSKHEKKEGSAGNFHHHFHLLQNMDHCQTWQNFFFYAKFDILPVIFFNAFSCSFHFLFYWIFSTFFQAFFPSTLDSIQQIHHSSSSVKHNNQLYWVPTKHEAKQALRVPLEPTISSQVSNEIEFQKSNELLIPGKKIKRFFHIWIFVPKIKTEKPWISAFWVQIFHQFYLNLWTKNNFLA